MSTFTCQNCQTPTPYEPLFLAGKERFKPQLCAPCVVIAREARRQAFALEGRAYLETEWERICPIGYRLTDPAFPLMDHRLLAALLKWRPKPDGIGIALHGETGMRKTRMMFLLLKALHFEGFKVFAISSVRLSGCFSASSWHDKEALSARDVIRRCRNVPVLFLDDLGKEKFTEAAQKGIWDLLETRTSNLRHTLWTANSSGEELLEMMFSAVSDSVAHDKAQAVVRRLIDFTEVIGV